MLGTRNLPMRAPTPSPESPSDEDATQREDPTPLPVRPRLAVATPRPLQASPAPRAVGTPPIQSASALRTSRPLSEAPPLQAALTAPRQSAPTPRTATGTAPPLTRQRRPSADEGIESGEIVERRSLVIRSQPVPVIEWSESPTDVTAPPISEPTARPWRLAAIPAAIVFAILAVVFTLRSGPNRANIEALESRAELLATTLDGDARAAIVRAEAIAASPVLRAAIDTDASTLADMARDRDMAFSLRPNDVIEIYQVSAGKRSLLLRVPADAEPLEETAAGQARIDETAGRVMIVASAAIGNGRTPVAGQLVIATPVDLVNITKRIAEHATGAQLVGMDKPIVLAASPTAPNAATPAPNVTIPIAAKTPVAGTLSLAAFVPVSGASSIWAWLCITLSAGLFATFVILHRRARREAAT
jgi:hypothetical protein